MRRFFTLQMDLRASRRLPSAVETPDLVSKSFHPIEGLLSALELQ